MPLCTDQSLPTFGRAGIVPPEPAQLCPRFDWRESSSVRVAAVSRPRVMDGRSSRKKMLGPRLIGFRWHLLLSAMGCGPALYRAMPGSAQLMVDSRVGEARAGISEAASAADVSSKEIEENLTGSPPKRT